MSQFPRPPETFLEFTQRFPLVAEAWRKVSEAGERGPLEEKTARLVKLGIAIGALREGAVHSAVRKALASGASRAELDQVLALAVSTVGFPASVAVFSWIRDELEGPDRPGPGD